MLPFKKRYISGTIQLVFFIQHNSLNIIQAVIILKLTLKRERKGERKKGREGGGEEEGEGGRGRGGGSLFITRF